MAKKIFRIIGIPLLAGALSMPAPAKAMDPLSWLLLGTVMNWALDRASTTEIPNTGGVMLGPTMQTTARWANRLAEKGVIQLGGGARLAVAQALGPGALGFDISLAEPSGKIDPVMLDREWAPGLRQVVCTPGSFWRTWMMAGGVLVYRVKGSDGQEVRGYSAQEKDCARS